MPTLFKCRELLEHYSVKRAHKKCLILSVTYYVTLFPKDREACWTDPTTWY